VGITARDAHSAETVVVTVSGSRTMAGGAVAAAVGPRAMVAGDEFGSLLLLVPGASIVVTARIGSGCHGSTGCGRGANAAFIVPTASASGKTGR